ncbi:MAG: putative phenylacetic acid degradation protein paaA [Polaromonas sp.]|nr:putative phenylacetic acid degradation protein paaA [Polaromonas sp.]
MNAVVEHTEGRIYKEGDADLPDELRQLIIRSLTKHVENSTNPHFTQLLNHLWERCMTLCPDEETKDQLALLMMQEVGHGVITYRILKTFGIEKVNAPIEQYAFKLPIDTWCDLCYFQALTDRVGVYVGENWGDVPYEPMKKVAPQLHSEELFHANLGYKNLAKHCKTEAGLAEANELIKKWWPAALDMFGQSRSTASAGYVKWGIQKKGNAELRSDYIRDTRPLLEKIGIVVPEDTLNRQFT